ncbi:acetoin utilization deacetylase AcuC-like enzyme [Idiomarina aquatica]|uniref:Acetoin utilization deacetylase AcuC-like enzyme n=1 Tax=Idiomarina aquatica TaxID=1327752 RepID=A0A4R6NYR9_9GAMM|nr:histone deacetylase [Idiomarina aquatica]MAK71414.1 histone deacetylase [Idiomarinaceae bacterium]TDP29936.1 acetoin utilization deacetylase AcuC-like enzyme [Idiomarina aquatica]
MVPFVYHPRYSRLELPPRHRYPIQKYALLKQWADEHGAKPEQWVQPTPLHWNEVTRVHCPDYITELVNNRIDRKQWRRVGFPWSEQLLLRTLTSAAGTRDTAMLAMQYGCAIHFSGGYHHAHYDWGSGFCLLNDLAIAAKSVIDACPQSKVLIFDTDVHQGDGTATLFADEPRVVTCSLHGEKNFPFTKSESDLDIELPKGTTDDDYLAVVDATLEQLIVSHQPDLILYDAGVDIYRQDELGHLSISLNGIFNRDYRVLSTARKHNISCAAVIGGGYQRNLARLIKAHAQLLRAAYHVWK